jgi:hypothetical protein
MRLLAALVFAAVLAASPTAHAKGGSTPPHAFGLGIVLGDPVGLAAKLYLAKPMALAFGLGEGFGLDGFHLHADVLWHPAVLTRTSSFTLPFYLGVGGRFLSYHDRDRYNDYDDTHLGVRVPFGLLMDFHDASIDVFLELAMVVDLIHLNDDDYRHDHDDHVYPNYAFGFRYYF